MASFLQDLWISIFTPGPTPTLLIATNASFALLQTLLFALLIATYSIHFLILSFLCLGLWWAINWFVAELRAAQAAEGAKHTENADPWSGDAISGAEAETSIDTVEADSKEVKVLQEVGELKKRGSQPGSKLGFSTEASTEDEWEKVSENEKDK